MIPLSLLASGAGAMTLGSGAASAGGFGSLAGGLGGLMDMQGLMAPEKPSSFNWRGQDSQQYIDAGMRSGRPQPQHNIYSLMTLAGGKR